MTRFVIDFGDSRVVGSTRLPRRVVFRVHGVQHFDGVPYQAREHAVPIGVYDARLDDHLPVFRYDDLEDE